MEKKICSKCLIDKNVGEFHKHKKMKDGLYSQCKECRILKSKFDYKINSEKTKKIIEEKKCCSCGIIKNISSFHKQIGTNDGYRVMCKDCRKEDFKLKYSEIKYKHRECAKNYRINNRDNYNKYRKKLYKLKPHIFAWRGMLNSVIRRLNKKKEKNTYDILGYTALDFKEHIEKQFLDGMSWDNWGEWNIDHIKPLNSFDKETDPKIINSLSNLQPLWAIENILKRDKILI